MINYDEVVRLKKLAARVKDDRLLSFMANPEMEKLDELLKANLQILFKEARKFKVRYIYVGKEEIAGCEGKLQPGSPWPAMWKIADNIGFPGSCGNSDQYQCGWKEEVFPADSYGFWDLKTKTKLTDEEATEKKFSFVVKDFRK